MLKLGGYINIVIALAHIIGLLWEDQMYAVTGIAKEMNELAQVHPFLPTIMTLFVSIVFLIFGLYGLSAANKFRELPFLKFGVFTIAGIYIFRGVGELVFDMSQQDASPFAEISYSLMALTIGLLFLFGGLKNWYVFTFTD